MVSAQAPVSLSSIIPFVTFPPIVGRDAHATFLERDENQIDLQISSIRTGFSGMTSCLAIENWQSWFVSEFTLSQLSRGVPWYIKLDAIATSSARAIFLWQRISLICWRTTLLPSIPEPRERAPSGSVLIRPLRRSHPAASTSIAFDDSSLLSFDRINRFSLMPSSFIVIIFKFLCFSQ
jgi:hypothetical protein